MLLEMHSHSKEHSPCSHVSAVELIRQVYAKGLQGVVFTDHHYLWPTNKLEAIRRRAGVPDHFLILSGQEVTTSDMGDILVYGADKSIRKGVSVKNIRARYPKAALILAHPYRKGERPDPGKLLNSLLEGVEIFSSNHSVSENSRGLKDWHSFKFTAIAGTDTHGGSYAGTYPTHFDHPVGTIEDLVEEIKKGRCRPFFKEITKAGSALRVTEITIGTKGASEARERIVVKSLRNKREWKSAERAYNLMEAIVGHGFNGGRYRVPRPMNRDEESMTLIEEGLRGKLLWDKVVGADVEDARYFTKLAAGWLAKLHNCRLQITPPDEFLAKEEKRLGAYVERFQKIRHKHARRANEIMKAIHQAELALYQRRQELLFQGHGDFHPKNIYIGQDRLDNRQTLYVAAIDFASSFCLPPAFDVGTFLAQFRNQFFNHPSILQNVPEEIFLNAYLEVAEEIDENFLYEVELFRARTNLGIASYLIKVGLGESQNLWRVLVEAEKAMAQFSAWRQSSGLAKP